MTATDPHELPGVEEVGEELHDLIRELFPICRSITGNGLRQTFEVIGERIPLEVTEVPTGTQVLDWTIPQEWNVETAWVAGPDGERVVDFADSNLHLLGYSVPVRRRLPLAELKEHLWSLPEHPDRIPFRNSYYSPNWGFCLPHRVLESLPEGEYEVCIDSTLEDGSLTYAEALVPGETADEVLVSGYACHPSMANDNLSGLVLMTALAKHLAGRPLRYSYRFLFSPGTIGPIAWLARNEERLERVKHGLVCLCVGDPGALTYKKSRRGDAEIDRAAQLVLRDSGDASEVHEWEPWGGDERQFNSPGFNLPVGTLTRSTPGSFPEYHTSADDLDFITAGALGRSFHAYMSVFDVLETNATYVNLSPKGEPQLGRRGLYRSIGAGPDAGVNELSLLWVLNLADGEHTLVDMAERSGLPYATVRDAARTLEEHDLLEILA
jgi:aminopeptidase-like protein